MYLDSLDIRQLHADTTIQKILILPCNHCNVTECVDPVTVSGSQTQTDSVSRSLSESVSARLSKTLTAFTENNAVYESRSISATDNAVSNVSLVQTVFYYYEIINDISAKRQ